MNQPKWVIRRYSKTWTDDSPVWVVTAPDVRLVQEKVWVNIFLPSDKYKYCDTFAEAIAWATRKTRTVEVELPKVEISKCINPDMSPAMFVDRTPGNYGIYLGHRLALTVAAEELKPLGEYLLALHYEKETK